MDKCYDITRDGFSLLVMGFTGKKALEWKIKYIEAFNSMERQLINVNSSIEEIVSRALSERTEEIVTIVLNEKLETIIVRAVKKVMAETFKEKLTEVASETAKTLIPCFEVLDRNLTGFAGHLRNNAENEKIFRLSPKLRQQVDKMIISGKYSCQQIADFITKKFGIRISPVTVSRYIRKYFVL